MVQAVSNNNLTSSTTASSKSTESNLSYSDILAEFQKLNAIKHDNSRQYMETMNELKERLNEISSMAKPEVVKTRKFMPDGSVLLITKEDGKIVEQTRKKPHMISVRDPISGKVSLEPFISIFDMDFM